MPRSSEKQQFIRRMYSYMGKHIVARLFRTVVEDDDSVEDVKDAAFASMIRVAESRRYLFRSLGWLLALSPMIGSKSK